MPEEFKTQEQLFWETANRAPPLIHHPVPGTDPTSARWWGGKARCCGMSRQEGVVPLGLGRAHGASVIPPDTGWGCGRQGEVGEQQARQSLWTFTQFPVPCHYLNLNSSTPTEAWTVWGGSRQRSHFQVREAGACSVGVLGGCEAAEWCMWA